MTNYMTLDLIYNSILDTFRIRGNLADASRVDFLQSYLRTQEAMAPDEKASTHRVVYHIKIKLDPRTNKFEVESNTGNRNMREGILMTLLDKIKNNKLG